MGTAARPPGPRGHFWSGNGPEFRRNPLGFLSHCARAYGDVVTLRLGRKRCLLLSHPDHIEYVLATGKRNFPKHSERLLHPVLGSGLLSSEGDSWLQQRRLVQPAFQRQRLEAHAQTSVAFTERLLATWQDGQTRDLYQDMMQLTLEIVTSTLFSIDVQEQAHEIGRALNEALRCTEAPSRLPGWLPSPRKRRLRQSLSCLDALIYRLIAERRAGGRERGDLLSLLLQGANANQGMSDQLLRDEVLTFLVAGTETTALALSWTWYLLAQDSRAQAKLQAELQRVLGGRPLELTDLAQLRYTERVVLESLRLFPPAYALGREAGEDCEIGGYHVPAGTLLLLIQWVLHRDPRFFDHPDHFWPDRWADGLAERLPKGAYFPFGAGPRQCMGNALAMGSVVLVLATIAQRFRLALAPGHAVTLFPSVTLRPRHGIRVVLTRRPQAATRVGKTSGRTRPPISLCLIVRNEEDNLPACLASVAHLVDEIIVVDTGSTDNTRAVAAGLGARVIDFTWCDDFAAARNEGLRHATGAWIFWLDADERLDADNQQRLDDLLAGLKEENVAYAMQNLSRPQTTSSLAVQVGHVRLFPNDPRIRWHYRVHETLGPTLAQCATEIRQTAITIEHLGYVNAERLSSKQERNLHLLRLDNAEHPDNPFVLFNLGFASLERGQTTEAVALLQRSLQLAPPNDAFVPLLYVGLAQAQRRLHQETEALTTLRTGRARFADDPTLPFMEGMLLAETGNYAEAEVCLIQALEHRELPPFVRFNPGLRGYLGRHYLAGVYCAQGRLAEAEVEWKKAVADWPSFTPAWRGLAELYAEQARWQDFNQVVEQLQNDPEARLDGAVLQAEGHLACEDFATARQVVQAVLDETPQALWPRQVLSRALLQEGRDRVAAENALRAVLAIDPADPEALYNLALLLRQRNGSADWQTTETSEDGLPGTRNSQPAALSDGNGASRERTLEEFRPDSRDNRNGDPEVAEAYFQLGQTFLHEGHFEQAVAACRQALRVRLENLPACHHLGMALRALGRFEEAVAVFRQALTLQPNNADSHTHLGIVLQLQGLPEEAVACYQRALQTHPDHYAAHVNLGELLADQGKMDEATGHLQAALAIQPTSALRVRLATLLPPIYQSSEDVRAWRRRLVVKLQRLQQERMAFDSTRDLFHNDLFYLPYQGENDRDIQRTLAQLYAPRPEPAVPVPNGANAVHDKIRVGFISQHLKDHTIGLLNQGLIANLSRRHFSVIVLSLDQGLDPVAEFIRQHADEHVVLPSANLPLARRVVAEVRLDVLFYTDIGMDSLTYTLAFSRLAPVQCVTWGHPVTTGIPNIDYFISSRLLEPAGADDHYTETLIRLKGLPIYYYRPMFPSPLKSRSYFGLSEDGPLYACPQAPFKLHPDFDDFLAAILRRDPAGQLALTGGKYPHWDELLRHRLATSMPDVVDRVHVIPRQSRRDFLNLLAVSDVLLDPIHFGGGNTSYEGLAMGVPIVTLPGKFLRGRITYALYQKMGVMDCVVSSRRQYVKLAVKLGTNPSYRGDVRAKILAANHALYEDITGVRELEEFLRTAVQTARTPWGAEVQG